jgi:hypothetical protein
LVDGRTAAALLLKLLLPLLSRSLPPSLLPLLLMVSSTSVRL